MRNPINLQNLKKYFTLTQLFILVLVANVISCKCGKNGDNQEDNTGKLTMEVAPLQLDPTKPATTVTFQLTEPGKKVDLTKFQLKAHLTKQEDGTGSKLKYQDAAGNNQEAEKIDAPLTHFTSLTSLADDNPPLKIDFTVLADKNVTLLVYQIEAFDVDNNSIGSFDVTYQPKKNQEVATLKLESNPHLEGNLKEIKLEVHNPSSEALAAGALKLQVKRTLGKDAIILGSMPTATPDTYELAINEEILATQSLHKTFMIDSQTDTKATFEIQLIQAATPGNKTTVHWEKGAWIDLTVKHEGNPRQLTYSIINSGTKEIKHAKLQYSCGTTGIKLAGKVFTKDQPEELPIGDLKVNKKIENQVLGAIDFGTNPNANFVCKVIYDGGASEEKTISCTATDVQLTIEGLTYDAATNQISYSIRNAGQDKADGVQMRYTNESKDEAGKKVMINNQTTATEAQVNIPKTATTAPVNLPIDFKQADEATFKFELLYKGLVINQTKKIQTFKAKEVKLQLVPISNTALTGGDQIFKYKIDLAADSRPITGIDPKQIGIQITNSSSNTSFISKAAGDGKSIDHLTGDELGNIGDVITLYINPNAEKQAHFSFELTYKNIPQGKVLPITWQEENIQIQDLHAFVGSNEATFTLFSSVAEIDHSQLTIEINSNNTANFTLIKHDNSNGGTSLTLDQLSGAIKTGIAQKTDPIRFKLLDAKGKDHAEVTVHVKRGLKELAKQTVNWKATGASLGIVSCSGYNQFGDATLLKLKVVNKGAVVNTDKIKVKFINDKNIAFKVGNLSANTTIITELNKIINNIQLAEKETVKFDIQQDGTQIPDLYATDIKLEILDEGGTILADISLEWVNQTKIDAELEPLLQGPEKLNEDLEDLKEKAKKAKKENNYNDWVNALKAIIQIHKDLIETQAKLNKVDVSQTSEALQGVIQERVQRMKELIEEVDQQIINLLQTEVETERKVADEEVKQIIENLASAAMPEDKDIKNLDKQVALIKEIYGSITNIANTYNTAASKKLAEEAKKIADETEAAAKKAKEDVAKKKVDAAYIKQIEDAATVEEALKVADELYDTKHKASQDLSKEALPAYTLVVQKAITNSLPITIEQIGNIIQSITTITTSTLIPDESKEKTAIALKDSIRLLKQNIEKDPSLDIGNIQSTIGGIGLDITLDHIKLIMKESSEIYKQAQQTIAEIDQLAKKNKLAPITTKMIDYAQNKQNEFIVMMLQKLQSGQAVDVNEKYPHVVGNPTALWLVVHKILNFAHTKEERTQAEAILRALLDRGADVTVMCGSGTVIDLAQKTQGGIPLLILLMDEIIKKDIKKALNATYNNGNTLLHLAVMQRLNEQIKNLIAKGVNINAQNNHGNTPLHLAVIDVRREAVKLLLDNNADKKLTNNKHKKTPYDINVTKGRPLGSGLDDRLKP